MGRERWWHGAGCEDHIRHCRESRAARQAEQAAREAAIKAGEPVAPQTPLSFLDPRNHGSPATLFTLPRQLVLTWITYRICSWAGSPWPNMCALVYYLCFSQLVSFILFGHYDMTKETRGTAMQRWLYVMSGKEILTSNTESFQRWLKTQERRQLADIKKERKVKKTRQR